MTLPSDTTPRIAVFLDRDGTLGPDVGYISRIDQFSLYPFAAAAVRQLNALGVLVFVVTNQAAVARGYSSIDLVHAVHARMLEQLTHDGAHIDGVYFCPYHPDGTVAEYTRASECRKPLTGMITKAQRDFAIDLAASYVVGDKDSDIRLAQNFGGHGILVLTGQPSYRPLERLQELHCSPPYAVTADLREAVALISQDIANTPVSTSS